MNAPAADAFDDQPPKVGGVSARWLLNRLSLLLGLVVVVVGVQVLTPGGIPGLARRIFPPPSYRGPVVFATSKTGTIYALRGSDGGVLWQAALGQQVAGGYILAAHDGTVYITAGDQVQARDARTGAIRWSHALPSGGVSVQEQDGMIAIVQQFPPDQAVTLTISALDERTGKAQWTYNLVSKLADGSDSSFYQTRFLPQGIYFIAKAHDQRTTTITALDPLTGAHLWDVRLPATPGEPMIGLDARDGIVAVRNETALQVFDARTGQQRWRAPLHGLITEDPVLTCRIQAGKVSTIDLTRHADFTDTLVAFDAQSGAEVFHAPVGPAPNDRFTLQPVNGDAISVLYHISGKIFALADGALRWQFSGFLLNQNTAAPPGMLYLWDITPTGGAVRAYANESDAQHWRVAYSDRATSVWLSAQFILLAGGARLQALDPYKGTVRWTATLPQALGAEVLVMNEP